MHYFLWYAALQANHDKPQQTKIERGIFKLHLLIHALANVSLFLIFLKQFLTL